MSLADNTWAFAKVLDDVLSKRRGGRAVILFPRSFRDLVKPGDAEPSEWGPIRTIIQDLIAADVVVVTCAGDDTQALPRKEPNVLNKAPAQWTSSDLPLLVAGAVTNNGDFAKFSRGVDVSETIVWAPGEGVTCALDAISPKPRDARDQKARGTGFSAGMVRFVEHRSLLPEIRNSSTP